MAEQKRIAHCCAFQPYLLWLTTQARKVNPGFQKKVFDLVGAERYDGDPNRSKIKKVQRGADKGDLDYAVRPPPMTAELLDVVRCLVIYKDAMMATLTFADICRVFQGVEGEVRLRR